MACVQFTMQQYEKLKDHYRTYPGDFAGAAKMVGVSRDMAKRAYLGPAWSLWPWAKPIKQLLLDEEELAQRRRHDAAMVRRTELASAANRAKEQADEANQVEENILKLARNDILGGLVAFAKLVGGIGKLSERVNAMMEKGVIVRKNPKTGQMEELPLDLDPGEAIKIMGRFSLSARALVSAADTVLTMQRLRGGLPTSIVGIELANVSVEDAEREVQLAQHALERAKELGLVVHKGGKGGDDYDRHFDRDGSDRD